MPFVGLELACTELRQSHFSGVPGMSFSPDGSTHFCPDHVVAHSPPHGLIY
jgi:hypothetical protein